MTDDAAATSQRLGKPMLANECIPRSLDDAQQSRIGERDTK